MNRRLRLQLAVGVVIAVGCVWVAFRGVSMRQLGGILRGANYWWLVPYPIVCVALNLIRSEIWRLLLGRRVSVADSFWAYSVGFIVNNVLPFRAGEAVRVGLLAKRSSLPIAEVAAAAGIERVLDCVCVMAILVGVFPFLSGAAELTHALAGIAATTGVLLAGLLVLVFGRPWIGRLVAASRRVLPANLADSCLRWWREMERALTAVRRPKIACAATAGTAVVWVLATAIQWTVLRAFQPQATIAQACVLIGVISLAGAIPATPGAIGTYQWIGQQALVVPFAAAYSPAAALAVALVSHAASYLVSTALGAIGLWYLGVPLVYVGRTTERQYDPASGELPQPTIGT